MDTVVRSKSAGFFSISAVLGVLVACFWAASSASPQTHLAPGGDKARVASAVQAPTCGVKRGKRVFVGFSSDMTLDAFEPAAVHAEHIMHTVGAQLCAAWRSSAPARVQIESSLRSAFSTGATLRVTDVLFGSADFASADVRLALVDA
ncbi:MAG TPA: hypothetical protein VHM19_09150, partial [Polyangiales bacterium]|nr:hypothetical protein [Polyangiales bacterium]